MGAGSWGLVTGGGSSMRLPTRRARTTLPAPPSPGPAPAWHPGGPCGSTWRPRTQALSGATPSCFPSPQSSARLAGTSGLGQGLPDPPGGGMFLSQPSSFPRVFLLPEPARPPPTTALHPLVTFSGNGKTGLREPLPHMAKLPRPGTWDSRKGQGQPLSRTPF